MCHAVLDDLVIRGLVGRLAGLRDASKVIHQGLVRRFVTRLRAVDGMLVKASGNKSTRQQPGLGSLCHFYSIVSQVGIRESPHWQPQVLVLCSPFAISCVPTPLPILPTTACKKSIHLSGFDVDNCAG